MMVLRSIAAFACGLVFSLGLILGGMLTLRGFWLFWIWRGVESCLAVCAGRCGLCGICGG